MSRFPEISDGQLFADYQMSVTDLLLMNILNNDEFNDRVATEKRIQFIIEEEIKDRFSKDQIKKFLTEGYPRKVDLNKVIAKEVKIG